MPQLFVSNFNKLEAAGYFLPSKITILLGDNI